MKYTFTRQFYTPSNASPVIVDQATGVEVFAREIETGPHKGWVHAVGFHGKAQRPDWNTLFANWERVRTYADTYLKNCRQHETDKQARRAERKAETAGVVEGDILYHSWGYDQTNIDWYQVTAVKGKIFRMRRIAGVTSEDGFMCGHTVPVKGRFIKDEQEITKRSLSMEYGCLSKWDGQPKYCSWYA